MAPVALLLAASAALLQTGCGGGANDFGWLFEDAPRTYAGQGPLRIHWRQRLTNEHESPYVPVERAAAVLDPRRDRVYVGSSAGSFYAMTAAGRRIYRYDAEGAIESRAAVDPAAGEVYVGTEQGVLHSLNAEDGELRWRDQAGGPFRQAPLLLDDAVYVVSETDVVTAFSRADGEVLWNYRREPPEGFSITDHAGLAVAGRLLITGFTDGTVVALDTADGRVQWERDTSVDVDTQDRSRPKFVDVDTTPVIIDGTAYVASFAGGMYALDAQNGTVLWHDADRTGVTSIAQAKERFLILASADDGVVCLELDGHREVWSRPLHRGSPSPPVVVGETVLLGESHGSLLALSLPTGRELGRVDSGHGFSAAPAVADGLGFVLTNGGALLAFSAY